MEGKQQNLIAAAGLYAALGLNTAQDFSGWPFKAFVFDRTDPSAALAEISVTADHANRQILLTLSRAANEELIPEGETAIDLDYVVFTKPSSAPEIRLFYGGYKATVGGPASGIA